MMILLLCFVKLLNNILSCSNEHVPYFFFFLKDKHCYDEPDVIPALHFHYSHKPICGIDFMQIVSGICINKILINTSEETSVLFDTKASSIITRNVRCLQVNLNKWIAIKKHGESTALDLLFF